MKSVESGRTEQNPSTPAVENATTLYPHFVLEQRQGVSSETFQREAEMTLPEGMT